MMEEAKAALARMPVFRGVDPDDVRVERLGGLTNRSYRVAGPAESYVLRLAGPGTSTFIDREAEAHNARIAARAGVNAEVVFFDTGDGAMLCRAIDNATPMDARTFQEPGAVTRAAAALTRLHGCGKLFHGHIDPFAAIDIYVTSIRAHGTPLPEGYREAAQAVAPAHGVLAGCPVARVPCHGDPVPGNFLDTGARMYLIDYEYAGSGDPMWDLAYLSMEGDFDPAADAELMTAYFGGATPAHEMARFVVYKAVGCLLSALWGAHRLAERSPSEISPAYVRKRLDRCGAAATSDVFARSLECLCRFDR